ncbi:MAG: hypothetical protein JXR64_02840 [Spirochaetales bacterium]|nr:hypothetical protein [Spirochaetales bacterium]
MTNQLDLFGIEKAAKIPIKNSIHKFSGTITPNHNDIVQRALNRLKNVHINETEQTIRDWVASDWHHGINPDYHVAAYNIGLLKVLKVNNEIIIKTLL